MKTIDPALQTLLNSGFFERANLFTFILLDGTILRYTDFDQPIKWKGNIYLCGGASVEHISSTWKNDLSVDAMKLKISPRASGLIEGVAILVALKNGVLDGAACVRNVCFFAPLNSPTWLVVVPDVNAVCAFQGRVADIDPFGRTTATVTVNSWKEILDIQLPRQILGSGCVHIVYDGPDSNGNGCLLNIDTYTFAGSSSGSPTSSVVPTGIAKPNGFFQYGILKCTSGPDAGLQRSVSDWISNTAYLFEPLPTAPSSGNGVTLIAGCDGTMNTCATKFNNLSQFLGAPFTPVAETIT